MGLRGLDAAECLLEQGDKRKIFRWLLVVEAGTRGIGLFLEFRHNEESSNARMA